MRSDGGMVEVGGIPGPQVRGTGGTRELFAFPGLKCETGGTRRFWGCKPLKGSGGR